MAAETGIPSVYLEHQLSHGRATKKTRVTIIEKLRKKSFHNHSWTDSIKSVRSSVAERRTQIENTEPSGVQQCLDTLQKAMKVKSQQTLKERLALIGRHLGLNTQIQDQKVSLGTDTFQVDVLLGEGGTITNVKLANQGDVVDCPDLKDILKKGDFSEFIEHLQGLQSIYQVTSDEKLKSKAFLALQALEKDLNQLAQFQSSISGVANYIHKCPLGIMLPRLAGKPMKLIYFVSPYDLLDKKSLAAHPLTVEAITENFLGQSVTVCIEPVPESAPANKLQTMPLMNVNKTQDGKSLPSFSAVSKINSMMLPASFVLVLPQSIPVSTQILQKITAQTNLEIHKEADVQSLRSLILESYSSGGFKDCRKLFVNLPDQQHIYFLDCLNGGSHEHQGVMVSRIPFTHPTHVPQILNLMRQQLLFNIVIGSCVRPGSKKESPNSIVFEITAISLQQLTIVFEHPAYDSMIRVDIDLSDITNLKCKVSCTNSDQVLCSDEAVSRVFHRCMSIPIMLRWLIAKGRSHLDKLKEAAALIAKRELLEKALYLKELQQQQAKLQPTTLPTNRPPPQPPHPPPLPPSPNYSHHHSPVHLPHSNGQALLMNPLLTDTRGMMFNDFLQMQDNTSKHINNRLVMSPDNEHAHNPQFATFLDEKSLSGVVNQKEVHDSPMLSQLLDDNTSVATTVIPMNCKPALMASAKCQRKRRQNSHFSGPSPKHHVGDNDLTERFGSFSSPINLDTGPSLMDHHFHNTPSPVMRSVTPTHGTSGHHHHHPLLTRTANTAHSQNNVIDLTEDSTIGESSLKKLADSMDKHFVHKDVKSEDLSMLLNEAEAQGRIPSILQNSPSGSKNENASTSLEVVLKGSGEVGRAKDFDPSDAAPSVYSGTASSKLSSLLLGTSDNSSPHLSASPHKANSMFFNKSVGCDESHSVNVGNSVSNSIFVQDMKVSPVSLPKGLLYQTPSVEDDKKSITGIFEKFDISRQQKNVKIEASSIDLKSQPECKVSLRLRVGPLKQQNRVKPLVKSCKSVDETNLYGKSNSIRTFDFKSDEDDDDNTLLQFSSDRYVYASSPTRLQISSNKHKQLNDYTAVPQKSDKAKKKDRSSGNTTKRKREKYESKREKKRKKSEFIQDSLYRTVENDDKADFKLKIRVAKKPMTDKLDVFSNDKLPSYEITKKPLVSSSDKLPVSKEEAKESVTILSDIVKEKDNSATDSSTSHKIVSGKSSAPVNKSSPKSGSAKLVQGSGSKTDPKLVTKATIRLKPLTMPNSGSTVNISQSGSKISSSVSGSSKTERRGSTSVATPVSDKRSAAHNSLERKSSTSNLVDRRNAMQSSTLSASSSSLTSTVPVTTATTPTSTANLSLSSILPNAPTSSKMASLPRIPKKLSSSSSSTSISRTSSLDPVSGSSPTSAGTKSNNSYTVGPSGRSNSNTTAGPGGNRPSSSGTNLLNYGSRPTTPGVGGSANNWSNFNSGRPGLAHRQTSPQVNSGPGARSQKLPGPQGQSPVCGSSSKVGTPSSNSHRHSGNFTNNSGKGSTGSSNSPQKNFSSGGKTSIGSKVGNNFMVQKSNTGSGSTVSGQRHMNHNTYPVNSTQVTGNSCIVNRSPNTSGSTKSPNSGKSPNLTCSGRSPSLSSASKSPNITGVNKSPNLSSSSLGKSPNLTPTQSPNVNNSSVRPASNSSSKSATPVPHRHLHSLSKPASVNKSILKTSHSSTSQRTSKSISGSIKPSLDKAGHKTSTASSNTPQMVDSNSVPAQHASSESISVNTSSINSSSIPPSTESASPCSTQRSSQTKPVSIPIATPMPQQTVKANSFDQTDLHKNSLVSTIMNESSKLLISDKHSVSSTPTTPCSADGIKSKFSFSSSKGRKSSLSAIVDKLKHNAVGAVLDSAGLLCTFPDGQTGVPVKALPGSDNLKSDVRSSFISSNSLQQDKRTTSSQPSSDMVEHLATADGVHKKFNHLLDSNQSKNTSTTASLTKYVYSETDCSKKSDIISNENACDRSQNIEDKSHCVSRTAEVNMFGRDTAAFNDDSHKDDSCSDSGNIKPDVNFGKDKRAPTKGNLLQQCLMSSVQESSLGSGSTPASPLASPSTFKNISPVIVPNNSTSKGLKHLSDQMFKLPSSKSSGDHLDEESRAFEVLSYSPELREGKLDNVCSGAARDSFNRWPQDDKAAQYIENRSSSKAPSSPLSDISSPESGLIIDDGDSKAAGKMSGHKNAMKPQSPKSARNETTRSTSQVSKDKASSLNCTPLSSSPKTSQPLSAKSPTLAKNPSGACSLKDSDSPCPIDDDLMDMALGFGS